MQHQLLYLSKLTSRHRYCTLLGFLFFITACASNVTNPLFLNKALASASEKLTKQALPLHVKESLDNYLESTTAVYFFVANDGGHTVSWVCLQDYCDYNGSKEYKRAKQRCQELRLGMDCTLLYLRKNPVSESIKFKTDLTYQLLSGDISIPPKKARGKIVYMPGFSGWSSSRYNFLSAITDDHIPPLLANLEENGWDVDILNILHLDRTLLSKHPGLFQNLLSNIVIEARQEGYQRIILYGGSRGGAEIMHSVQAGVTPDAIALMEPDWQGPKYNNRGVYNTSHASRGSNITSLLSEQGVDRIVFSFFKDSRWYLDITKDEIEQAIVKANSKYFLIAAPDGLEGHGGSWTHRFSKIYAQCLNLFFLGQINSASECKPLNIDESNYENWATKKPIIENGYRELSGNEILTYINGRALCPYNPAEDTTSKYSCRIWTDEGVKRSFLSEFDQLVLTNSIIDLEPSGYCRHNGLYSPTYRCSKIYIIEDNLIAIAPNNRNNFSWFRLMEKNEVEVLFGEADFFCNNLDKLEPLHCESL